MMKHSVSLVCCTIDISNIAESPKVIDYHVVR